MVDSERPMATNLSLLHLDPEPISSPATENPLSRQDLDYEDDNSDRSTVQPGSTYALGLSGSGRGAIYYLSRIQKYSSYSMAIFTTLHITNVSLIPATTGSVDASETFLLMTREIYQTTVSEPLLIILPFVAHIGSGIALRLVRRAQNARKYGYAGNERGVWPPLSWISVSGYALTLLYSAHAFMNRILPLAVEGDSSNIGLAFVAHGFARHQWTSRIAYTGLISLGAGHMVWGLAKWNGMAPSTRGWLQPRKKKDIFVDQKTRRQRRSKWMGVHGAALTVSVLWAIGGLGVVASGGPSGGWVGNIYDDLYKRVGL